MGMNFSRACKKGKPTTSERMALSRPVSQALAEFLGVGLCNSRFWMSCVSPGQPVVFLSWVLIAGVKHCPLPPTSKALGLGTGCFFMSSQWVHPRFGRPLQWCLGFFHKGPLAGANSIWNTSSVELEHRVGIARAIVGLKQNLQKSSSGVDWRTQSRPKSTLFVFNLFLTSQSGCQLATWGRSEGRGFCPAAV